MRTRAMRAPPRGHRKVKPPDKRGAAKQWLLSTHQALPAPLTAEMQQAPGASVAGPSGALASLLDEAAGPGEKVLLLLLASLGATRPQPTASGAEPSPHPPTPRLLPATLLALFRTSIGLSRHVLLTARQRVTPGATPPPSALPPRLAVAAPDVALVLRGPAIPDAATAGDLLARASRLELHAMAPSLAQLAALGQRATRKLHGLALVECTLPAPPPATGQQQQPAPPPPVFPAVHSLEMVRCVAAAPPGGDGGAGPLLLAALPSLVDAARVQGLVADAPGLHALDLSALLPALTRLDAAWQGDARALLAHARLQEVTLRLDLGPDTTLVAPEQGGGGAAQADGARWRRLTLVGSDGEKLRRLPLDRIQTLVIQDGLSLRVHDWPYSDEKAWERLEEAAAAAGTELVFQPSAADGVFTVHCGHTAMYARADQMCLEDRNALLEDSAWDECCPEDDEWDPDMHYLKELEAAMEGWFNRVPAVVALVGRRLLEGAGARVVLQDCCPRHELHRRRFESALRALPRSKVRGWELEGPPARPGAVQLPSHVVDRA